MAPYSAVLMKEDSQSHSARWAAFAAAAVTMVLAAVAMQSNGFTEAKFAATGEMVRTIPSAMSMESSGTQLKYIPTPQEPLYYTAEQSQPNPIVVEPIFKAAGPVVLVMSGIAFLAAAALRRFRTTTPSSFYDPELAMFATTSAMQQGSMAFNTRPSMETHAATADDTETRKGPWPEKGLELIGRVVSTAMDKTVVVEVERRVLDPKYKKYKKVTKKYKAHDENNEYQNNDLVVMRLGRPLSKTKRFVVVGRV